MLESHIMSCQGSVTAVVRERAIRSVLRSSSLLPKIPSCLEGMDLGSI